MSREDIVIADGMNYIKGYRYQLYCEAKALMTPSCVVQIAAPADKCRQWNNLAASQIERTESTAKNERKPYAEDVLDSLIFRYEEPNGMTRWDSPLFVIPWEDKNVPGQDVWDAMVNAALVRPHQATVMVNYAHIYDSVDDATLTHKCSPASRSRFQLPSDSGQNNSRDRWIDIRAPENEWGLWWSTSYTRHLSCK